MPSLNSVCIQMVAPLNLESDRQIPRFGFVDFRQDFLLCLSGTPGGFGVFSGSSSDDVSEARLSSLAQEDSSVCSLKRCFFFKTDLFLPVHELLTNLSAWRM